MGKDAHVFFWKKKNLALIFWNFQGQRLLTEKERKGSDWCQKGWFVVEH